MFISVLKTGIFAIKPCRFMSWIVIRKEDARYF